MTCWAAPRMRFTKIGGGAAVEIIFHDDERVVLTSFSRAFAASSRDRPPKETETQAVAFRRDDSKEMPSSRTRKAPRPHWPRPGSRPHPARAVPEMTRGRSASRRACAISSARVLHIFRKIGDGRGLLHTGHLPRRTRGAPDRPVRHRNADAARASRRVSAGVATKRGPFSSWIASRTAASSQYGIWSFCAMAMGFCLTERRECQGEPGSGVGNILPENEDGISILPHP